MYSSDRIVVDEDSLYPKCYVCSQKYNVFDSININDETPILLNCGHTICYNWLQSCLKNTKKEQIKKLAC